MKQALMFMIFLAFLHGCTEGDNPTIIQPVNPSGTWKGHPELDDIVMYEVNLRAFSNEEPSVD